MSLEQQQAFHKNNIDREVAGLQPLTWDAYMASMGGAPQIQRTVVTSNQVAPAPQIMMQPPGQMMAQQPGTPLMMVQQPVQPQMMTQPQAGIQYQQSGANHHEYRQQQPIKKFNSKICGCIDFWE